MHPGGIKTNIVVALESARAFGLEITPEREGRRRLYEDKLLKMRPDQAAEIIIAGVAAGRTCVLVGNDARAVDALVRLLPARYPKVLMALESRMTKDGSVGR